MPNIIKKPHVIVHHLNDNGLIPNNPRLPLLVYQHALNLAKKNPAVSVELLFKVNQWGGIWHNGIFQYDHYHSTAHEVLVCCNGTASVQFGGEGGVIFAIKQDDVVLIPAGVGHKNLGASPDFRVVGAYPTGQSWDLNTGQSGERPQADQNIARVPLPETDPIYGLSGPLHDYWYKS